MADQNEKWEMPKPIFRSSDGSLPRRLQATISGYNMPRPQPPVPQEDDDILSVLDPPHTAPSENVATSERAAITGTEPQPLEAQASGPEGHAMPAEEPRLVNSVRVRATTPIPKRQGFLSFLLIFFLIAALAAAVVAGVVYYFLPRYMPGANGPF